MLRRSFLQLMGAALMAPAVSRFEVLAPAVAPALPVLAVEASTPYWLLEMQAYERLYAEAWQARKSYTLAPTQRGRAWSPTFPTHPLQAAH